MLKAVEIAAERGASGANARRPEEGISNAASAGKSQGDFFGSLKFDPDQLPEWAKK
jgi:hypothetical protein